MPLLGVTAVSTMITALKGTAFENYTMYIIAFSGLGAIGFIWAYDRFKVLNLQQKHDADRSSNFVGPSMAMSNIIQGRQMSVMSKAIAEGWDRERIEKEMDRVTKEELSKYRDGIDMSEFKDIDGLQ